MSAMNLQCVGRWVKSAIVTRSPPTRPVSCRDLLVRPLEELVEQAELVHHLERRGMDGVAAEVAEEIRVLLQDDDVDAGTRQQEAQHHAGRTAAGHHALHVHGGSVPRY